MTEKYGKDAVQFELIPGDGGVFDVVVDGERVFSKKEARRFPAYQEIPLAIDMKMMNR